MRIQNLPSPSPTPIPSAPRNLPTPTPPAPAAEAPSAAADQVHLTTRPKKTLLEKVGGSLVPALEAAALGAFASASNPVMGTVLGGLGGTVAGYSLGAGVGKFTAFKLAESGAKAGGGGAILGGIGALAVGFGAPVFGTLAGAIGGAVLPQLASPLLAASILGGTAFVGNFLRESA